MTSTVLGFGLISRYFGGREHARWPLVEQMRETNAMVRRYAATDPRLLFLNPPLSAAAGWRGGHYSSFVSGIHHLYQKLHRQPPA